MSGTEKRGFKDRMSYMTGYMESKAGKLMNKKDWIDEGEKKMNMSKDKGTNVDKGMNAEANVADVVDTTAGESQQSGQGMHAGESHVNEHISSGAQSSGTQSGNTNIGGMDAAKEAVAEVADKVMGSINTGDMNK
ncbi:hypothetical protein BB559_001987 [Furculomyces boomerangus]|uniref:Uncharacterized protein n=1 Tax=Furculomyces boomerangus TaxID=61424 RepID=A0A2T9YZ32_9FUNG|nr:hypothetical protein BB559_001987 [Furculomyces boomerangus]